MATPDLDRFDSRRSTAYAPNGIVATSQPLVAEAGVATLRDGGNAFDAAVATAAALNVVEPTSTGLGGDVFALSRTADGDVGAMRSCGGAPGDATIETNHLEPGKRPFHTLVPAVAKFDEDDWAAFGAMGGYMQPQGHVQVISNIVDYDLPLQAALDRPRFRYRENGQTGIEERLTDSVPTKLARKGHDVSVLPPVLFGGAQIVRNDDGTLSGATEPRKDGVATGY